MSTSPFVVTGSRFSFVGCEVITNQFLFRNDCATFMGCDIGASFGQCYLGPQFSAPTPASWSGWGLNCLNGTQYTGIGTLVGYHVSISAALAGMAQTAGTYYLLGGNLETAAASTAGGWIYSQGNGPGTPVFVVGQDSTVSGPAPSILIASTSAATSIGIDAIAALTDSGSPVIKLHRCVITSGGVTGQAIRVYGNTTVTIGSGVTGTGGAIGINSSRGAKTYVAGAAAVTGAGGNDLTTDNGATFTAVGALGVGAEVVTGTQSAIIRIS